ncbi:MAG: hypothetical protein ACFFE8_03640 [Candidatus Heimdallarchaeota archaeon]
MADQDYLQYENLYGVPSAHFSVEFALKVRQAFFEIVPDVIAVELPPFIRDTFLNGIKRLPVVTVLLFPNLLPQGGMTTFLPIDPCDSMVEALRLAEENDIHTYFIDMLIDSAAPAPFSPFPDPYTLNSLKLTQFIDLIKPTLSNYTRSSLDKTREAVMAHRLYELMDTAERVLWVGGIAHWQHIVSWLEQPTQKIPLTPKQFRFDLNAVKLAIPTPDSLSRILGEIPLFTWLYTKQKDQFSKGLALRDLYKDAELSYNDFTGQKLSVTQYKLLMQYSRNLALVKDLYFPDFMEIIRAAKACVSDDYAWDVYTSGKKFPPNDSPPSDLPLMDIQPTFGLLDGETIRLRRHLPRLFTHHEADIHRWLRERPKEDYPGQWREIWDIGGGLWGHVPDEQYHEGYFDFVRRKAKRTVTTEKTRTFEFTSSLLDGIDYRETIRNVHTGKLYVREFPPFPGTTDVVVIVFDPQISKYPFWEILYAEHSRESDLLLYSTAPGEQLVGPGISRVEIGGCTSVFPPRGIRIHPEFSSERPPDVLLLNGISWAREKLVVYVAKDSPSRHVQAYAGKQGKRIVYIPLSAFSPASIEKLRQYHLLRDISLRRIANRYVRRP